MALPDGGRDARFWTQLEVLRAAAAAQGITIGHEWTPGRNKELLTPDLLFEDDTMLVAQRNLSRLPSDLRSNVIGGRGVQPNRADRDQADDVVLVHTGGQRSLDVVTRLNDSESTRDAARPNHVVSICGGCICPASEPVWVPPDNLPVPRQAPGDGGHGIRVQIIDTGIWPGFAEGYAWFGGTDGGEVAEVDGDPRVGRLRGVTGQSRLSTIEDGVIGEYVGHGVFVAGVLRCVAPGTTVHVANSLAMAGADMEDKLGQAMVDGLIDAAAERPHIISLSAGSVTFDDLPYLGLEAFFTELRRPDCTTLLVAAAGNEGETHRFFPAALAETDPDLVIGVGALRSDGWGRACFSNYGEWVSVYAPGERLVNRYLHGTYRYIDPPKVSAVSHQVTCRYYDPPIYPDCSCLDSPPQHTELYFDGMAEWSGTSFSTPYVAGRIAEWMTRTGEQNARVAAKQLLATLPAMTDAAPVAHGKDPFVLRRVMH
jgi:hypothetical protein